MGYRCPVCDDPQADDVHLANHLAFTAIARGGDHEAWLDEHVPEWGSMGEADLAAQVREYADSAEYPAVFEDTTGRDRGYDTPGNHGHGEHGHGDDHAGDGRTAGTASGRDRPEMADLPFETGSDEETDAILERARELTRRRRANATDGDTESPDSEDES